MIATPGIPILALEGPCLAGKSTLAQQLTSCLGGLKVVTIPCYADLSGNRQLPEVKIRDVSTQHAAVRLFLEIEAQRKGFIEACDHADLFILDRSVDTLLAHTNALDQIYGINALSGAREIVAECDNIIYPDLTLYLEVPPAVLRSRAATRPSLPTFLLRDDFLEYFRQFFQPSGGIVARNLEIVPATASETILAWLTIQKISSHGMLTKPPKP